MTESRLNVNFCVLIITDSSISKVTRQLFLQEKKNDVVRQAQTYIGIRKRQSAFAFQTVQLFIRA